MIFDNINRLSQYESVAPNIAKFAEYLKTTDITALEPGRYVIDGDVYFDVKLYEPRLAEKAGWETHRLYLDIQYLIEGRELMGVSPAEGMTVKAPYDEKSDKQTYLQPDAESVVKMRPGTFTLLLPQDAHHPSIIDGEATQNKKAVVKIKL